MLNNNNNNYSQEATTATWAIMTILVNCAMTCESIGIIDIIILLLELLSLDI